MKKRLHKFICKKAMRSIWIFALVFAVSITMFWPVTAKASSLDEIQKQQSDTQSKINDIESQKSEAEDTVDSLQNEADALEDTLDSYTAQLESVNAKIESTKQAIDDATASISELQAELEEAKQSESDQYEAMKTRIGYMYENFGHMSLLETFLESGSITEFLNQVEYVTTVMEYDRALLTSYQELQETISSKTEELEKTQTNLADYQNQLSDSQDEMSDLVAAADEAFDEKSSEVSAAKAQVEAYESDLSALNSQMASLRSAEASAQAAIAEQIAAEQAAQAETGTVEDTSQAIVASNDDVKWLAATLQAECGGASYRAKYGVPDSELLAVASVVLNRVNSNLGSFKNQTTILSVISANMQFESWRNGKIKLYYEAGPDDKCMSIAQQAINGARNGDYLFFMTQYWADYYGITGYTTIGNMVFFRVWGEN
ncbi:MAG: cell wall hydrolase [Lachnospiraceae bacterium]|nr:cell wall hydrolase [Lachnospiraceae bacterium]